MLSERLNYVDVYLNKVNVQRKKEINWLLSGSIDA